MTHNPACIGGIPLHYGLIHAPLAGYSCSAMRRLAWGYGCLDYACSEMLSAKHIAQTPKKQRQRYTHKAPDEGPLCIQLAGNHPDHLCIAAETAAEWGAFMLDLNAGCPQPKIRKKNLGSALLCDSAQLKRCLEGMQKASGLPVTLKIRVDGTSNDRHHREVAQAAEDAGAAALIVHGRHWTQRDHEAVHYHQIAEIKQSIRIPVIGNGGVHDHTSAERMRIATGCDAVMVANGCLGRPWIFKQLYNQQQGNAFIKPTRSTQIDDLLKHRAWLIALDGLKSAHLQTRGLLRFYLHEYLPEAVLKHLQTVGDDDALLAALFRLQASNDLAMQPPQDAGLS
jgi:tRNA-dihydrouridine synthase B